MPIAAAVQDSQSIQADGWMVQDRAVGVPGTISAAVDPNMSQ